MTLLQDRENRTNEVNIPLDCSGRFPSQKSAAQEIVSNAQTLEQAPALGDQRDPGIQHLMGFGVRQALTVE